VTPKSFSLEMRQSLWSLERRNVVSQVGQSWRSSKFRGWANAKQATSVRLNLQMRKARHQRRLVLSISGTSLLCCVLTRFQGGRNVQLIAIFKDEGNMTSVMFRFLKSTLRDSGCQLHASTLSNCKGRGMSYFVVFESCVAEREIPASRHTG
jgi:hypothetical protein